MKYQKAELVPAMPASIGIKPSALLWVAVIYTSVVLALFAPQQAEAMASYVPAVITNNYPGSKLGNMCANCHVDWSGGGPYTPWGTDYNLHTMTGGVTPPLTNPLYTYDQDNDGSSSHTELTNSQSATRPALPNRWFPAYPDKDGDGCILLFNRFGDSGAMTTPYNVTSAGYVGASSGFITYGPQGWDVDDNDATQGCSTAWPTSATPGAFVNPGTTTDVTAPAAITNFRANGLLSAAIPLVWTAPGDDGTSGAAHNYDLKYTTAAIAASSLTCGAGTAACNVRVPADWSKMYDRNDTMDANGNLTWNTGTAATPLMRAYYEPIPSVAGAVQACNAIGQNCAASPGASYILSAKGSGGIQPATNVIVNGTTYWLAVRASDGVARPSGTLNAPGTITENLSLSNIIAVTAGTDGAAISSISPAILSGASSSINVSVDGFGLNSTQAAQMVLTNSAGTAVAAATGLSYSATGVAGSFASPIPDGVYNLELRTASAITKAAWVNAVTVSGFTGGSGNAPTLTLVTPNSRGQNATAQSLTLTGTNFADPMSIIFSDANISGTVVANSATTATATIETVGAVAAAGSVIVSTSGGTSNPITFTVTAAPVISNTPPNGNVGVPYSHQMTATGGSGSNVWSASGLPSGLSISSGGLISGTPNTVGTFVGSVTVIDANAGTDSDATSVVISDTPPNVDLVMTAVSTKATNVRTGRNITVSYTVKNQGLAATTSGTTVGVYLSTDATITTGDILIGNQVVSSLAAGASLGASASMQVNVAPGTYYLGAIADKDNSQQEFNETNNSLTAAARLTVKP